MLRQSHDNDIVGRSSDRVSIIIPARNEAATIGAVLESLLRVDYQHFEIIVVDDQSVDDTVAIASAFPVKILSAGTRPSGWMGKTWACQKGAEAATGRYLLFTDADTIHTASGLQCALAFLKKTNSQLLSATAFHANRLWWQKLLGPFYCLICAGASPTDPVSPDHPYALGQYLLVDATFYRQMGGHSAVRSEIADDASLARHVMLRKGVYTIYHGNPPCEVQMYSTLTDFINGWHRILRLGMNELNPRVLFNTMLPLLTLNIANLFPFSFGSWLPLLSTVLCFAFLQQRIGRFSVAGILVFPLPMLLFVIVASRAAISHFFNLPLQWRGRKYNLKSKVSF
jgi:glycosyltransferase involved in cell wall biosynthesis